MALGCVAVCCYALTRGDGWDQVGGVVVASNVDVYGDSRSRSFCHTPRGDRPMFNVSPRSSRLV